MVVSSVDWPPPGRAAADQVAHGDDVVAGAAVDGRSHLGELDIELRLVQPRPGGVESGLRLDRGLAAAIEFLGGDGAGPNKVLRALCIVSRELKPSLRAPNIGLGRSQHSAERARIDHEQQIALLDDLAFLEMHRFEIAADARPDFHRIDRRQTARVLVPFGDFAHDGLGDVDLGRRRRGRTFWLAAAASPTAHHGAKGANGNDLHAAA